MKAIAESKQKQRLDQLKSAPASADMFVETDERENLARHYVPKAYLHEKPENLKGKGVRARDYKPGSTMTACWTADNELAKRKMVNKGYMPVMNEEGLQVADGGGDLLWEAPIDFEKHKVKAASVKHRSRLDSENKQFEDDIGTGGIINDNQLELQEATI